VCALNKAGEEEARVPETVLMMLKLRVENGADANYHSRLDITI